MSESLQTAVRVSIAAAVVLTCVVFSSALADPVNVIKLTVLDLAALTVLLLLALGTLRRRVVTIPTGPAAWAAVSLAVAFLVATAIAPNTTTAVVGTYGRNSGLLAYGAALVLFAAGMRVWTGSTAQILALGLLAAGLFTSSYGLLQYAGIDPVAWKNPFSPIIASLGNPDFASAYLGICTPVAAWGALWQRWAVPWRVASGVVGAMCLVAAVLSKAVQGPLAALAGLAVLAAALLLEHGGPVARRGLLALASIGVIGVATLAAGAAKLGPAAPIFRRYSFQARQFYWDGALRMFDRHPIFGVGLDHYGAYWRQVRSDDATRTLGGQSFSDAAHSVPLQMFAQGGLILGLTYMLFVGVVATYLVRGLLRLEGPARLQLGALGGAWAAYVVSAAVSIDQVPLVTVEFATAGAVVALAGQRFRELRLPGALVPPDPSAQKRGRRPPVVRERALTGTDFVLATAVSVALLVGAWFSLLPLRANAAVRRGDAALAAGKGDAALAAYQQSNSLLPGVGAYWGRTGSLYETAKRPELALPEYLKGVRHDPFDLALLTNAARLAAERQQTQVAAGLYRRMVALDPTNPETVQVAADFETAHGQARIALSYLAHPLALFPNLASLWAATGSARAAASDSAGARRAFSRAIELDPRNAVATAGLSALK